MIGPSEPEAYYLPRGNSRYEPARAATESPRDPKGQHGGPPAALLVRVIDLTVEGPLRPVRINATLKRRRFSRHLHVPGADDGIGREKAAGPFAISIRPQPNSVLWFAHPAGQV
jgi:hypothetical protein